MAAGRSISEIRVIARLDARGPEKVAGSVRLSQRKKGWHAKCQPLKNEPYRAAYRSFDLAAAGTIAKTRGFWCRERESNPQESSDPVDFESTASANSAIPAAGPRV